MKAMIVFLLTLFVASCGNEQVVVKEFTFRKKMEEDLIARCKEKKPSEKCVRAVKDQIKTCIEKSDWRKFTNNQNDQAETQRFINVFYPCFLDSSGKPYFPLNAQIGRI